ncbi:MAG: glycine zipper protein [Gammaproteobacteria bacterium]|jgi:outer membrane protein OmpA-like peptidoglycan-associated protein|nr:glycine zipper protein [Gammaproteobacteria bacterium]
MFSKLVKFLTLASVVTLTACTNLADPAAQLQHSLSPSAARIQQSGGQLIVVLPIDNTFQKGFSRLTPQAEQTLAQVARTLQQYPDLRIKIVAYTDNRGDARKNQLVSLRRAMRVADYFRAHGVTSSRISTVGMGAVDPVANNATAQGRAQNRRIELQLS